MRARRSRPAAAPSAAASTGRSARPAPQKTASRRAFSTIARSVRLAPSSCAKAPIGVRHEPSSACSSARSAASASPVASSRIGGQRRLRRGVAGARGDRDRALPRRGGEFLDVEQRARLRREAKALQPGEREQRRVDLARRDLAKPRFDIAAQQRDREIGPQAPHHRGAAQRSGADDGAVRQVAGMRAPAAKSRRRARPRAADSRK